MKVIHILHLVYLKNNNKLPNEKRIFAGVVVNKNIKDTSFYKLKGKLDILFNIIELIPYNLNHLYNLIIRILSLHKIYIKKIQFIFSDLIYYSHKKHYNYI